MPEYFATRDCLPEGYVVMQRRKFPWGFTVSLGHQTNAVDLQALHTYVKQTSRQRLRPLQVVEVGSWVGESAVAIRTAMQYGGTLWCVDNLSGGTPPDSLAYISRELGQGMVESVFRKNCHEYIGNSILLLKMDSSEAAELHWGHLMDLIFLDAGHREEDIREDLDLWWPLLAPGGVFCGHDYGVSFYPGVKKAVDEFAARKGLNVESPPYSEVWRITKPGLPEVSRASSDPA